MPTNRQRRTRRVATLTLDQFWYEGQWAFMRSWRPPLNENDLSLAAAWRTWEEYFADYDAVRDELLASPRIRQIYGDDVPFADAVRTTMLEEGQIYDAHRHRALLHPHPYVRGDEHVHDGFDECLGPAVEVREESEFTIHTDEIEEESIEEGTHGSPALS